MNKGQFEAAIAEKAGMSKKDAGKFLDAYQEVVTEEMKKGGKIQIIGFGTYEVSDRAERVGRNPSTKEKIIIPRSKNTRFKPGKALKNLPL